MKKMVEMNVVGIVLDPTSNMPIVILKDKEKKRTLPIWVGMLEAGAIAMMLEGVSTLRPLTHDLIRSIIEGLGVKAEKVTIDGMRRNTFLAKIFLRSGKSCTKIDARPSDAVVLALRMKIPIYVSEQVLSGRMVSREEEGADGQTYLENLKPEDFGRYKM